MHLDALVNADWLTDAALLSCAPASDRSFPDVTFDIAWMTQPLICFYDFASCCL